MNYFSEGQGWSKLRILLRQIELGQAKLMEFEFVDLTPLHMLLSEGRRTADAAQANES
jgi:hypothetical protein